MSEVQTVKETALPTDALVSGALELLRSCDKHQLTISAIHIAEFIESLRSHPDADPSAFDSFDIYHATYAKQLDLNSQNYDGRSNAIET